MTHFPHLARCLALFTALSAAWVCTDSVAQTTAAPPPAACVASDATPATFTRSFSYGGTSRSVTYIQPVSQSGPAPAYVLLTYLGGSASSIVSLAQAQRLAQQYCAWVIVPASADGIWNDNPPLPGGLPNGADDSGFLAAVIDDAVANDGVDPDRVVMGGFSDGALMTAYFACVHPELIRGAVLVAGTELQTVMDACAPARPVSIVDVMGTSDLVNPYYLTALDVSAASFNAQWLRADGCAAADTATTDLPAVVQDGTSVTLSRNAACSGNTLVELYTVADGGHAWPGSTPSVYEEALFGITSQNLDALLRPWLDLMGN